jgi:glucose/arabinose dehydrogenase
MRTLIFVLLLVFHASYATAQLRAIVYASGFAQPLAIVQDPTNPAVQFVLEQAGRIRVVQNGTVLPTDFLDLSPAVRAGGEQGLLGMAFPPDAATSGRFFVNFTNPDGHTVVARFKRSSNPLVADPASRFDLRWNGPSNPAIIEQPFTNHNGGHLAFGPDGFLYIGMGDGGSANDPAHRAQDGTTLLGKMLRIDVNVPDDHPIGYTIPTGNPFVGTAARPEIWSVGWRNPWRFTFDDVNRGGTGAMIAGDVGQNAWEEINYEPRGAGGRNYGWRNREGAHDNVTTRPPAFTPLIDPIHEYSHAVGSSITGGYIYRGQALPSMRGRYFFADFIRSRVWSMNIVVEANGEARAVDVVEHTGDLGGSSNLANVASFGVDADGELFIVSYGSGVIHRIVSAIPPPTNLRIIRQGRT